MAKRNKSILITGLLFILLSSTLTAQVLYVDDATGNDLSTGTSLASAWKTIQHAMDNASAGNIVSIRGGTYHEQLTLNISGTIGNNITFTNYKGENVYIDGNNGAVTLLHIGGKNNIVIEGFIFQNTQGNNSAGVVIDGISSNITFRKNKIRNIKWTASAATIPSSSDNCNPFVVYGNNANIAISNISIDSNEISNNITGFSESMTLDGNIDGFSITNNLVHDNTNIGILCAGNYNVSSNPTTDHTRNGVVQNNSTYNCLSPYATSGGIYIDGGLNIIVERNKTYGNGYGIEVGCEQLGSTNNITVRDNIIFDNKVAGLAIGGYNYPTTGQVLNCIIENNTLYNNDNTLSGSGEILISKVGNSVFYSNIIFTNAQNIALSSSYSGMQGNTFNYNAYYIPSGVTTNLSYSFKNANYLGLSNFQTSTAQEAAGIFTNPNFINPLVNNPATIDFSLSAGSLCIDAGIPSHTNVSNEADYFHNNRVVNSIIDIGAVEFGSVSTSIKPDLKEQFFTLFPNPLIDQLSITNEKKLQIMQITVLNQMGEIVITSNTNQPILLEALLIGFYVVTINTEKGIYSYKIMKQ